jgi:DNA-binding NtrC family response regulator
MRRAAADSGGREPSSNTWRNCVVGSREQRAIRAADGADAGEQETSPILFAGFRSATMLRALEQLGRLARDPEVPILLEGESGTGKTLIARHLHALSPRARGPFHQVLLAAVDDQLAGSELFGHVAGAFTDARHNRSGCFVSAHQGTLFLDEVGKASLPVQQKLLHAIEHGEIHPLGSDRALRVDVRVVAASNIPIADIVASAAFLPDLYARLETFRVRLPALRERRADIPLLVERCLAAHTRTLGADGWRPTIDGELMRALELAPWPHNVRQLSATIRRLMLDADGAPRITMEHCTETLAWLRGPRIAASTLSAARAERATVECENNKSLAARTLGVNRSTLYRALGRHSGD